MELGGTGSLEQAMGIAVIVSVGIGGKVGRTVRVGGAVWDEAKVAVMAGAKPPSCPLHAANIAIKTKNIGVFQFIILTLAYQTHYNAHHRCR